jgi:ferredoxin-NADP reductase
MWRVAALTASREETPTARTLQFKVQDWPGHDAGQHVDVRLTSADGYSAVRSYSIANAPEGDLVELTVERLADGEVSPYLTQDLAVGDSVEVRGPLGGWFVWRARQTESVQLIAGGSGLVPLMCMLRTRSASGSGAPFRLLYSVRAPDSVLYAQELQRRAMTDAGLAVTYSYTRALPAGWSESPHRIDAATIAAATWPSASMAACYICGPTAFVETAANLLVGAGYDPSRIKTERFGPSGGGQ